MINESLSQNSKIAYNLNQVSFKTNTVNSILQHLAWQYNDKYLGVIKSIDTLAGKRVNAELIQNISNNGTPLIFRNIENSISELVLQNKKYILLKLEYLYIEREDMTQYINSNDLEFIVLLYNGCWYKVAKHGNESLFDEFDDFEDFTYSNIELPKVKLPKIISPIANTTNAKNALKNYATDYNLVEYNISTFEVVQSIAIKVQTTISKFSSFTPDINEFVIANEIIIEPGVEVPYIVDKDNSRIIMLYDNKWHLINDDDYVNIITTSHKDIFIDSMQNSVKSAELNKNLKADDLYAAIARVRAVGLLNNVVQEFTHCGYYYCQNKSFSLTKYNKFSINSEGFMSKIATIGKTLTLYKDSIICFAVNIKTKQVMLMLPTVTDYCYIVNLDDIPELVNEFYKGPYLDTVVSISDIYFAEQNKKKK